jgi:hypothetical protein
MIFLSLCAFIWFKNMRKMMLQMTSGFLQLESTLSFLTRRICARVANFPSRKKNYYFTHLLHK